MNSGERLISLEGLRGVAAVVVVIFHALLMFYPNMFHGPGANSPQNMFLEDNIYGTPLAVFLSGVFAVAVFFVLSGFVLSIGFFSSGKDSVVKRIASKRYLRLMIPALASVVIAWALISLNLAANNEASEITGSNWLSRQWSVEPSFFQALSDGLWGVFANGSSNYNGVLWTMKYEFMGSFIIFGLLFLFGRNRHRWVMYIFSIVVFYQTWYLGFILGMMLADLYANRKFPFTTTSLSFGVIILLVALFLGGYPDHFYGELNSSIYSSMTIGFMSPGANYSLYLSVGAALLISAILIIPKIKRLLEAPAVSVLGKYTYSLYLVHYSILFTVCASVFVYITSTFPDFGFNKSALVSIALTLPVIALATWLFEKYIDAPSIRFSSVFARWIEKGDKSSQ